MNSDIRRIQEQLNSELEKGVAELAIKIVADAQMNSRVDTGKYRGSWRVSKGVADNTPGEFQESPDKIRAKIVNKRYFDTVYITNIANYSKFLEAKDSTLKNAIFRAINT